MVIMVHVMDTSPDGVIGHKGSCRTWHVAYLEHHSLNNNGLDAWSLCYEHHMAI